MLPSEQLLEDLAGTVLDGGDVDWASAESSADADTRPFVRHLRLVASVAEVHRHALPGEGETWGHLRLLERVGQGAFGEVLRAWDTRLDREVALKILAESPNPGRGGVVIREGRLLARVRHQNVVTIHGAERIGDRVGLWMEFVHGRTLEDLLKSGRAFTPDEVVHIGLELARAVAAVHAAGLLHRDIKAQNVMRADDGRIVLMDFGSGRELDDDRQALSGTPVYLAPELFSGGAATVASDVYSLGVLLFHLLTGSYPVNEATLGELQRAHKDGRRTKIRVAATNVPSGLACVIDRALDPRPERRFQTADALAAALGALTRATRRRRAVLAAVAATLVALLTWSAWPDPPPVIGVLALEHLSSDPDSELVAAGLTQEVVSRLAQIDGLTIRSLESSVQTGERRNLAIVRQADVNFVLAASVVVSNGRLGVNASLIDLSNESTVWKRPFERVDGDVFATLEDLARSLVEELRLEFRGGQRRHRTDPALELLFLKARGLQQRRNGTSALEAAALFEQIVARDPGYAPAVAALARSLGDFWRLGPEFDAGAVLPRLGEAALEAIRLDPLLADAQAALGLLHVRDRQWASAEAAFLQALKIDPSQGSLYVDYAVALLLPLGRVDDALDVVARARAVAPLSLDVRRSLALMQIEAGLYDEAIKSAQWVLQQDPDFPFADAQLGRALILSGRPDDALPYFSRKPEYSVFLGYLYAVTGRRDEAEALAAGFPPARQFWIYAGLGDKDRAFEALDRAVTINPHSWRVATWMNRAEMKILRGDPRFQAIRRRLGLPEK
ncbi:MAG TPA: protein kinase [Vicinamibacterales bacterium]|nr:protein kinase [Vicinamibacterales bacterium]